jgi:uncharacterized protein (TIGR03435 family)
MQTGRAVVAPLVTIWLGVCASGGLDLEARNQAAPPSDARLSFEVVSLKRNTEAAFNGVLMLQPGGRVASPAVTARQLILVAYGLEDVQVVGGPSWMAADRFAIDARADASATRPQVRLMVRSLLAERFGLAAHGDRRELPTYALVAANRDGRLGPRLRRSGPECAPITPPPGVPSPPPPPPGPRGVIVPVLPKDPLGDTCGYIAFPGWISARRLQMQQFTIPLTQLVQRSVTDETGLTGPFDLDVTYTPDLQSAGPAPPGAPGPPPPSPDRPSLFTALQEDLGLKLEGRRGLVDVLVIDRLERPAEN